MDTLSKKDLSTVQCYGRMTRKKFKIHGMTIYSEKRCHAMTVDGRLLCVRCLARPPGPTRHGNQEGYQVNQGQVNSDYPPWSAIFGSNRYLELIEEFGEPDDNIYKVLVSHQQEARQGCVWMNKEIKELYDTFQTSFGESKPSMILQNREPLRPHKMPKAKKTSGEKYATSASIETNTDTHTDIHTNKNTNANNSPVKSEKIRENKYEKISHNIKDFIRPVQYIARSRDPYLVQEIVHINRAKLQQMIEEDGIHFEPTK
jgi:hypothetical protein